MKSTSITILDIYPSVALFIEQNCKNCNKKCEVPSIEMFACVLKKLNKIDNGQGVRQDGKQQL